MVYFLLLYFSMKSTDFLKFLFNLYWYILYIYIRETLLYILYEFHIFRVVLLFWTHKIWCLQNIFMYLKIYALYINFILIKNKIYYIFFNNYVFLINIKILYTHLFFCEIKKIVYFILSLVFENWLPYISVEYIFSYRILSFLFFLVWKVCIPFCLR